MIGASVEIESQRTISHRYIHVWKFCCRARVKGLAKILSTKGNQSIKVLLNGTELSNGDYRFDGERVIFRKRLEPDTVSIKKYFGLSSEIKHIPRTYYLKIIIEGPVICINKSWGYYS